MNDKTKTSPEIKFNSSSSSKEVVPRVQLKRSWCVLEGETHEEYKKRANELNKELFKTRVNKGDVDEWYLDPSSKPDPRGEAPTLQHWFNYDKQNWVVR